MSLLNLLQDLKLNTSGSCRSGKVMIDMTDSYKTGQAATKKYSSCFLNLQSAAKT